MDRCGVKGCGSLDTIITYYGHSVCRACWVRHSDETKKFNLKKEFGIKEPPPVAKKLGWRDRVKKLQK